MIASALTCGYNMGKHIALPHLRTVPAVATELVLALLGAQLVALAQGDQSVGHLAAHMSLGRGQARYPGAEHGGCEAGH